MSSLLPTSACVDIKVGNILAKRCIQILMPEAGCLPVACHHPEHSLKVKGYEHSDSKVHKCKRCLLDLWHDVWVAEGICEVAEGQGKQRQHAACKQSIP